MQDSIENTLKDCLLIDRQKLLRHLPTDPGNPGKDPTKFTRQLERARLRFEKRQALLPSINFTNDLPIHDRLDEIKTTLQSNQVVIISGETGSGKTTQLPKICLAMGQGKYGFIGHTQPRRLAARTVASRIAEELGVEPGEQVGFKIRHTDRSSSSSFIKVMTDGILLAELQTDRKLLHYDTIIIDEAHERTLNIDFLLGYLKQLLPSRPDLKVIITSATIDVDKFSTHFDNAPVIEVSGRTFPVETRYRPVTADPEIDDDNLEHKAVLQAIHELSVVIHGDILVFLEGEREIHQTARFLDKQGIHDTDILPLYSRLSTSRQTKLFQPHKRRRIVLATNVAETSLTIPGIRYVIDRGYARISRYSRRTKVQQLPVERISKASADQRQGRCGRTAEGICIRLYSEEDYLGRPDYTEPEITRTNLASVILQMKAIKLGDISKFSFVDKPDKRYINDGLRLLEEIGAIDQSKKLTGLGKLLCRLPVDPRSGAILFAANKLSCLAEILVIVSALSGQDPRERPLEQQEKADRAHADFQDERSDFLFYLNLWNFYQEQSKKLSQNKLRKLCRQKFLSYVRINEWKEIYKQLQKVLSGMGIYKQSIPADYDRIHCALLSGLMGHVACKNDTKEYTGARGIKLHIFPGSSQFRKLPKWIVADEMVETSKLYARTVAAINPQWLLKPARHLLKQEIYDPAWDTGSQQVLALEKLVLYGLVLVTGQRVNYGKTHPVEARKIFITEALVNGKLNSNARFIRRNNRLLERLRLLENKKRQHDIVNEDAILDFYDKYLPAEIHNGPMFEKWYREAVRHNPDLLAFDQVDVCFIQDVQNIKEQFPDKARLNNAVLPLDYKFEQNIVDDGINLELPLYMLNQVQPSQLDSLVPGIIENKIQYLLKGLPKQIRKKLVPVPATAEECSRSYFKKHGSIHEFLSDYLLSTRGITITRNDWEAVILPDHLKINICVRDDEDRLVAQGRDLLLLQQELSGRISTQYRNNIPVEQEQEGYTSWSFNDLQEFIVHRISEGEIKSYPSLVDKMNCVGIRYFDTRQAAEQAMQDGLRRLFMLSLHKEYKNLRKNLLNYKNIELLYASVGDTSRLYDDLLYVITDKVFLHAYKNIRTKKVFNECRDEGCRVLYSEANTLCNLLYEILGNYKHCRNIISTHRKKNDDQVLSDIEAHLDSLVYDGFLRKYSVSFLEHFPRYLLGIRKRLEKLVISPDRDKRLQQQITDFSQKYSCLIQNENRTLLKGEIENLQFMLEEYRVSLFAQELGTAIKISSNRIQQELDKIIQNDRLTA